MAKLAAQGRASPSSPWTGLTNYKPGSPSLRPAPVQATQPSGAKQIGFQRNISFDAWPVAISR